MRASILGLFLPCACAQAGANVEASRFEIRATRVEVAASDGGKHAGGRFSAAAHVSTLETPRDPLARFQATAAVKASSASCGPRGDAIFADGFE